MVSHVVELSTKCTQRVAQYGSQSACQFVSKMVRIPVRATSYYITR